MGLSDNNKKLLVFSKKKACLIFQGTETLKKFIFQETELSYISANGNPKKRLIYHEANSELKKKKNKNTKTKPQKILYSPAK